MKKVIINILSPGRFHVCDLARELDKQGFDVKFYSFVPSKRTEKFGLPSHCSSSLFLLMIPFLVLERKICKNQGWAHRLRIRIQDYLSAMIMRNCDVCIAMSGVFLYAPRKAKKKGSIIIYERGSKHILEQKRVLEAIPSLKGKTPGPFFNVQRELASYEIADYIAIPSLHVKHSFALHHYPTEKLFLNPYGVNVSMFYPAKYTEKQYDLLMVGNWGYQKGCDLIVEAVRNLNLRFLHVGGIGDLDFPKERNFIHYNPVDESELVKYYHKSKIFILPSRQDGFGMVLSQALACNLPIVGSPDCGAPDLKAMVEYPEYITIIRDYTVDAVCVALQEALKNFEKLGTKRYAGNALDNLTWEAYGRRYADFLNKVVLQK